MKLQRSYDNEFESCKTDKHYSMYKCELKNVQTALVNDIEIYTHFGVSKIFFNSSNYFILE